MKNTITNQALDLSEDILKDIELSQIPLTNIALKAARLARLLDNFEYQKMFQFETSGYPTTPDGIQADIFELAKKSNRSYTIKDEQGNYKEFAEIRSIEQCEHELLAANTNLNIASDADISISSSNPTQHVFAPSGNFLERSNLRNSISQLSKIISERRSFIYNYVLEENYKLKFSKINVDIFSHMQSEVDAIITKLLPDSIRKFTSIYNNLLSENQEDWSNAVHSCRRILQDLADSIYPSRDDKKLKNGKTIKLGKDNYINRLIAYIETHENSERFKELIGSNLNYIGNRLDAIFQATQKGSHTTITTKDEANRYVIYTYLLVGDILKLHEITKIQSEN